MTDYRTCEQFQSICDNMYNGNWTDAAKECAKYGFYANDLHNAWNGEEFHTIEDPWDFVELIEIAGKYR